MKSFFITKVIAALLLVPLATLHGADAPKKKPNVLFIVVDDLRPELACYGAKHIVSPNIDRLAASGRLFSRAYCQVSVCNATRTSLLTGLRPDTTGVTANNLYFRKTTPKTVTVLQHFKQHGYQVEGMGKIFHHDDADSWSVPVRWPRDSGNTWRDPENVKLLEKKSAELAKLTAEYQAKGKATPRAQVSKLTRGPAFDCADVPDNAYHDGQLADMAVSALDQLAGDGKPFFLAVGFAKPHLAFNCPKRYWDLYDPTKIRLADNAFPPEGAPEFAMHSFVELRSYHGIPASGPIPEELARKLIHGYYASVSYVDAQIGRVLDTLERLKLSDNTIVILWGDHGWHLGDHGLWCKATDFETATRAPLILRVPGMKTPGRATSALVEFLDVYPSLTELAGLPLPAHLEGKSFVPQLGDPDRPGKTAAFSQYPRSGRSGKLMGYSMRTDRYRLTRWVRANDSTKVEGVELYDHQHDPQENRSIANDPKNAALIAKLSEDFKSVIKPIATGKKPKNGEPITED